jgi:hypothetical protein
MWYGERFEDPMAAARATQAGLQAQMWTAFPGIVEAFNADNTVNVTPAIQGSVILPTGIVQQVNLPLLQKCPVVFPMGGGIALTFPITAGDEVLIVVASRCIDTWWEKGGINPPVMLRMHDINDGFCIPGITSLPNVFPDLSKTSVQLRTKTVVMMDVTPATVTFGVAVQTQSNLSVGTGASGSFTTPTGQTVTVRDGIITNIYP